MKTLKRICSIGNRRVDGAFSNSPLLDLCSLPLTIPDCCLSQRWSKVNRNSGAWHRKQVRQEQMKLLERLEEVVSSWPNVSTNPHRFGGREFRFAAAEVGHIHPGGVMDIPFPRSIHDALLSEGLAQQHRWVPDSGWVTFRVHNDGDLNHALWLMRISYL